MYSSFYKSFPFRQSFLSLRHVPNQVQVSTLSDYSFRTPKSIRRFSSKSKNYYDVLGITPKASQQDIKAAYFKLSKLHHPDVNKDNADAAQRFREVTEAYDMLSNAQSRKQYDNEGSGFDDTYNIEEIRREKQEKRKVYTGRSSIYNYDEWLKGHYTDLFQRRNQVKMSQEEFDRRMNEVREFRRRRAYGVLMISFLSITLLLMIGGMNEATKPYHGPNSPIITKKKSENNSH